MTKFTVYARLDSTTGHVLGLIGLCCMALFFVASYLGVIALSLAAMGPVVFAYLVLFPAELVVGADGFLYRTKIGPRFVSWRDVEDFRGYENGINLRLKSGEQFAIPVTQRNRADDREVIVKQRAIEAMSVAFGAYENLPRAPADHVARIAAGEAREGNFRVAPILDEHLWQVVESVGVDPAARTNAAAMLAKDAEALPRLRVLAEECVEPELRAALAKASRE